MTTYKVDTQHSDTMAPGIREVSSDQPLWTTNRIMMILDHLLIFRVSCSPVSGILMTHSGGNNAAGKYDEVNDELRQRVWNWGI